MQQSNRGMGIPRSVRSVFVKDICQLTGEIGQMFQRNGAILDKGHRLSFTAHGHHDVEALCAHAPNACLECGVLNLKYSARGFVCVTP